MANFVTSTVTFTKATINTCSFKTASFEEKTFILIGSFKDDEAILKACKALINDKDIVCGEVKAKETSTKKFAMTEESFITLASKVDKRSNGNFIFRTISTNKYDIVLYNIESKEESTVTRTSKTPIENKFTARKLFTALETDTVSIGGINKVSTIEDCYSMKTEDFVKYGKVVIDEKQ